MVDPDSLEDWLDDVHSDFIMSYAYSDEAGLAGGMGELDKVRAKKVSAASDP